MFSNIWSNIKQDQRIATTLTMEGSWANYMFGLLWLSSVFVADGLCSFTELVLTKQPW
jgi:hypothetical protein